MYEEFINIINNKNNKKFMIISHINPDGDTCGCALALYKALVNFGKEVEVFCSSEFNSKLSYIPNFEVYNKTKPSMYDVCIAVDCADEKRLGDYLDNFLKTKQRIVIDHHGTNTYFGQINYVNPKAAAACEIIYEIIQEMCKIKNCFDDDIAKALYSGIITDSGNFMNSNTTDRTKEIAKELAQNSNINTQDIINHFMNSVSLPVFKLKNLVLSKAKFYEDNKIGIIYFSIDDFNKTGTTMLDTEGIINEIKNIDGIKIAVAITQKSENDYKISLRSVPSSPVDRLAASFGGGGHPCAAGFALQGNYYDVLDRVIYACKQYVE